MNHRDTQEFQKTGSAPVPGAGGTGKLLYFDYESGISGDMSVAALLGLGIDREEFHHRLDLLGMPNCRIEITSRRVCGTEAVDFTVHLAVREGHHRTFGDIIDIFEKSRLSPEEKNLAVRIFRTIAEAEAAVHGVPLAKIHFHEVGAADSIIDIAAVAICVTMLRPDRIVSSRLPLGTGHITCAHGVIPVPVPATVEIIKGVPVYQTETRGELITPTGAAIITNLAGSFGPMPPMTIEAAGYGAGKKKYDRTNILRVVSGISV